MKFASKSEQIGHTVRAISLPGPLRAARGLADGLDLVEVGRLDAAAVALTGVPLEGAAAAAAAVAAGV